MHRPGAWAGRARSAGRRLQSAAGELVGRRDLLGGPFDDLGVQALLLPSADDRPLHVRDLLAGPAQELSAIGRRAVLPAAVLGFPGVAPIRLPPGRGSIFRERL